MNYKIDWLTLTLKPVKDNVKYKAIANHGELCPLEQWCFDFLGLSEYKSSFRKKQGSIQHYNVMYSYNGLSIALSVPERFSEQGLMLRFSGDAIAWYEKLMRERSSEWSWVMFLKKFFSLAVYGLTCKCTRIDLAFDDIAYNTKDRLIDLKIVKKALERGEFVSAFRSTDSKEPCKLISAYEDIKRSTKGDILGETYYLGNRKSKVFLRFYDKLLECKAKREPYDETIKHWVRMEFEFKDIRAMTVCDSLMMLQPDEFGKYMSKVTNHYVRFVIPKGTRHNYSRCRSRKWWSNIVGTIEKSKLVENKAYRNRYESTMRWLRTYVFPSLFAVLHCVKVDDLISDIHDSCIEKMNGIGIGSTYDSIIKDYFNNSISEKYSGIDIHRASAEDFNALVRELDICVFESKMKLQGYKLCQILDLVDEYKKVHLNANISGMYNKNILEYKSEQMQLEDYPFPYYA